MEEITRKFFIPTKEFGIRALLHNDMHISERCRHILRDKSVKSWEDVSVLSRGYRPNVDVRGFVPAFGVNWGHIHGVFTEEFTAATCHLLQYASRFPSRVDAEKLNQNPEPAEWISSAQDKLGTEYLTLCRLTCIQVLHPLVAWFFIVVSRQLMGVQPSMRKTVLWLSWSISILRHIQFSSPGDRWDHEHPRQIFNADVNDTFQGDYFIEEKGYMTRLSVEEKGEIVRYTTSGLNLAPKKKREFLRVLLTKFLYEPDMLVS
jgi:hypothetical protein